MIEDESLGLGKPKIYTEVEKTPLTIYYIPVMNEESMNEAKPEKEKKRFWCCC